VEPDHAGMRGRFHRVRGPLGYVDAVAPRVEQGVILMSGHSVTCAEWGGCADLSLGDDSFHSESTWSQVFDLIIVLRGADDGFFEVLKPRDKVLCTRQVVHTGEKPQVPVCVTQRRFKA